MPSPGSDPQPQDPQDASPPDQAPEGFAPTPDIDGAVNRTPLEQAEGVLRDLFEMRAQYNDWEEVPQGVIREETGRWERAFLEELVGDRYDLRGQKLITDALIIDVRQDEDNFYVLASLTDESGTRRYYCDGTSAPIALVNGATCGVLLAFAKEEFESDSASHGFALLVDEHSLELEAERFARLDFNGLVGALLREEAHELGVELGGITAVKKGILSESEIDEAAGFHILDSTGAEFLFELSIRSEAGGLCTDGPLLLSEDTLIPDTSFPDALEPGEIRARLMANLANQGLRPLSESSYPALADLREVFVVDAKAILVDWQPQCGYSVSIASVHLPQGDHDCYLVEVVARSSDGSYLLPARSGSAALRSASPISMFFEAVPQEAEGGFAFNYRSVFLALPPDVGQQPLINGLMHSPQQSWMIRSMERAIASALMLPLEQAAKLRVYKVLPLSQDPEPTAIDEPELEDGPIRSQELLCYHDLGASVVTIDNDSSGLIFLKDINARFFFPGLMPPSR